MTHLLFSIGYSPWSERARWALDCAGIGYQKVEYLPGVTELRLRALLRRPLGRVTVPVLLVEGAPALDDSLAIARWASAQAPQRLPLGERLEESWALANRLLEAGRVRTTYRALEEPALLKASLPPFLARAGGAGLAVGRVTARHLLRKYPVGAPERCLVEMREALIGLRGLVGGRETIHARFSCADIGAATALAFVSPVPGKDARLSEAARAGWTEPALAEEFADLVAWRDQTYARYRPPPPGVVTPGTSPTA
jgi:glutathione S-transferase